MKYVIRCYVKGRPLCFRYAYPDPVSTLTVLAEFQREIVESDIHPADINFMEIYNRTTGEKTSINSLYHSNQPLYFDWRLS